MSDIEAIIERKRVSERVKHSIGIKNIITLLLTSHLLFIFSFHYHKSLNIKKATPYFDI